MMARVDWRRIGGVLGPILVAVTMMAAGGDAARAQPAFCPEGERAAPIAFPIGGGRWIDARGRATSPPPEEPACRDFRFETRNVEGVTIYVRPDGAPLAPGTKAAAWDGELPLFSEGLQAAADATSGKVGFLDRDGRWAIAPQFDDAAAFSDGLAAVRRREDGGGGKIGFVDHAGKLAIPYRFEGLHGFIPSFSEGRAAMPKPGATQRQFERGAATFGYIDKRGAFVIAAKFQGEMNAFSGGLARVAQRGRLAYIDRDGAVVWPRPRR